MAEMDFNQAMKHLVDPANAKTPAKQPESSNSAPANAWRAIVDAQASEKRGGEATPQPFHTPKGTVSAVDAWRAAIKPAA